MVDLAHPALVRRNVQRAAGGTLVGAVHINDGVVHNRPGVAKDRSAWQGRCLGPLVLCSVVYLNIWYDTIIRTAADQIDVAIAVYADDGVADWDGHVFAPCPLLAHRIVDVYIGQGAAPVP